MTSKTIHKSREVAALIDARTEFSKQQNDLAEKIKAIDSELDSEFASQSYFRKKFLLNSLTPLLRLVPLLFLALTVYGVIDGSYVFAAVAFTLFSALAILTL